MIEAKPDYVVCILLSFLRFTTRVHKRCKKRCTVLSYTALPCVIREEESLFLCCVEFSRFPFVVYTAEIVCL